MSTDEIKEVLKEVGFSPNEAKIYQALLGLGEASVARVSERANLHRRNVYDAVNRLVERGLVFQRFRDKETVCSPVDPEKLAEMLRERHGKFLKALPYLKGLREEGGSHREGYIYKGLEGFKNYVRDMLRVGEDVYMIGGFMWVSSELEDFLSGAVRGARRADMKFRVVFDSRVEGEGFKDLIEGLGVEYKFLPERYSGPSSVDVFGGCVGAYGSGEGFGVGDVKIFIVEDKDLADSVRRWNQFVWDTLSAKR